jgi:hypothetical protein
VTAKRHSSGTKKLLRKRSRAGVRVPLKVGRPEAFQTSFIERAAKLYRNGAIDEEVAKSFKVALSTLYKWKAEKPEFSEAIKAAREVVTDKVEAALFKRATGFHVESVHFTAFQGAVIQTKFKEYYPPDTGAALGWLKANRPDRFREVSRVEHSGKVATTLEEMSVEELAAAKERLEKLETQS